MIWMHPGAIFASIGRHSLIHSFIMTDGIRRFVGSWHDRWLNRRVEVRADKKQAPARLPQKF